METWFQRWEHVLTLCKCTKLEIRNFKNGFLSQKMMKWANSVLSFQSISTLTTPRSLGGYGVIFLPKKINFNDPPVVLSGLGVIFYVKKHSTSTTTVVLSVFGVIFTSHAAAWSTYSSQPL